MKNAITILVDSVIWDYVGTTRCKISPTPFLDSLKSESITATKLYSYGPYTDAATRSLYTGRQTLDDYAYFFKLNTSPTHHYKVFHDNGYETYGFYYPYYMIGKEMKKYVDNTYYTAGFIFNSEWGGCFYYYAEIIKRRQLNDLEIVLLKNRVKLMMEVWIDYYEDVINNPQTADLIRDVIEEKDVKNSCQVVKDEFLKFQKGPVAYIYDFLSKGKNHILASLNGIDVDMKIDRKFLNDGVYNYYKDFFSLASKNNFKANWRKNCPGFKRVYSCISRYLKTHDINDVMLVANYFTCLNTISASKKQSQSHWQDIPSAKIQLDYATKVLEERDSRNPFYMSLHFLEAHNYVSFFSFDTKDRKELDEEFKILMDFCKELGSDFIGSLTYILSIRYLDYCIERFCKRLMKLGLWDSTVLTVVADHGSSYSFYPLHGRHVNCFDEECYHVPLLIRNPSGISEEISTYHNSKDVLPTLYEIMGFEIPSAVIGKSMLNKSATPKDYVMTEYMGPGCPDLMSRPIWFSIRDKNFAIGYIVGVYQNFDEGDMCEVYDLKNDPNAYYNIVNRISKEDINYLLVHVKERFDEIKVETNSFVEKILNNEK